MAVTAPGGDRPAPKAGAKRTAARPAFFDFREEPLAAGKKGRPSRCREKIGASSPSTPGETVHRQRPLACEPHRQRENGGSIASVAEQNRMAL